MDTSTTRTNVSYCSHRLPCGVCRLAMTQCPKESGQTITWISANSASTPTVTTRTSE